MSATRKTAIAILAMLCFILEPGAQEDKAESRKRGDLLRPLTNSESSRLLPGGGFDALIHLQDENSSLVKKVALPTGQPAPVADPSALLQPTSSEKSLTIMPGGGFDGMVFLRKMLLDSKGSGALASESSGSASSSPTTLIRPVRPEKAIALMPGGGFDALIHLKGEDSSVMKKVALPAGQPTPDTEPSALIRPTTIEEALLIMPGGAFNGLENPK